MEELYTVDGRFEYLRFEDEGCGDSVSHIATCYDLGPILLLFENRFFLLRSTFLWLRCDLFRHVRWFRLAFGVVFGPFRHFKELKFQESSSGFDIPGIVCCGWTM